MFVHAREADSPTNMRYMGLLVDKYVPDTGKAKGSSWAGVGSHSLPPLSPPNSPRSSLSSHVLRMIASATRVRGKTYQTAVIWGRVRQPYLLTSNFYGPRGSETAFEWIEFLCMVQVLWWSRRLWGISWRSMWLGPFWPTPCPHPWALPPQIPLEFYKADVHLARMVCHHAVACHRPQCPLCSVWLSEQAPIQRRASPKFWAE